MEIFMWGNQLSMVVEACSTSISVHEAPAIVRFIYEANSVAGEKKPTFR